LTGAGDTPDRIGSESAAEAVAQGQAAYGIGRLDEALAAFDTAIARAPGLAIPRYNAAATLFQLGRFTEARQRYLEARERAGRSLQTKIDYALGNTALVEGDIPGAIRSYDLCLASTARGAALEAVRRDAAINRNFALEQSQSLAVPDDKTAGEPSESRSPDGRRNPNRHSGDGQSSEGQPESDQASTGASSEAEAQGDRDRRPASRRRLAGRVVERRRLQEREVTRRTTGSTPRSSTSGLRRPGVSPILIRRLPPTTTARIGELIASIGLFLVFGHVAGGGGTGQSMDPLRVQADVAPGPYFAGQGFDLRVSVVAGGQRPKIDAPRMTDALAWTIDSKLRPLSATGIGSVVARENLFVVRFRVVPKRAGTLVIPAIQAESQGRSGRSQPKHVLIQPVPSQGRTAEFLGGVGRFELNAEVSPKVVRVGQELEFRIKITGPAAWGMTGRPDLGRFGRLRLGLRIEPMPDLMSEEPPARTFVYGLRPTKAGEAVLPPVVIAAFDPSLSLYFTHATAGVPIRVVAVPSFDPTTIEYGPPATAAGRLSLITWGVSTAAILLVVAFMMLTRVRRRLQQSRPFSPDAARRFARRTARYLGSVSSASPEIVQSVARRVVERLAIYLRLGTGHFLGALTPDEARSGVAHLTSSDELAQQARQLIAQCDSILYGDLPRAPDEDARQLLDDARRLFAVLGRVKTSHRPGG
jgi:hypothetical protein